MAADGVAAEAWAAAATAPRDGDAGDEDAGAAAAGGFSGGGLLAYEMAVQLTAAGERVAFLALFDSYIEGAGGYWLKSFYSKRALRMAMMPLPPCSSNSQ